MAKLIIYRGDVLDREVDLGEENARIGRGDDNEIVLTDPIKSVSRHHCELRFEQGKYSIFDTNSQNGVWVEGRRVPNVTLEPGIPVVLGTYKLLLKEERPPADTGDETILFRQNADAATIVLKPKAAPPPSAAKAEAPRPVPNVAALKPEPPPVPKSEPKPAPPPAIAAAPPAAPKPAPQAAPKPAPPTPKTSPQMAAFKPEQPAAAKPPAGKPAAPAIPPAAARPAGKSISNGLLFGGLAVVLVAVVAAAVFLTPLRNRLVGGVAESTPAEPAPAAPAEVAPPAPPPEPPATRAGAPRPAAGSRVARGDVKPAPSKPPTPAAAPGKPPAAAATARPVPAKPTTPVAPPPAPTAAAPTAATPTAAAPAAAAPTAAAPPPAAPPPAAPPPAARPPAPPAAVKEANEKPLDLAGMFEEARSAMIKGDYLAAITGFEAVLKVDPNYPSAANLLGVTRGGAKNASQLAIDSGNKSEMSGDYESARKQYDRALLLDPPSSAAADAMRRLKARMQGEGEDTFKKGRQYDAMGRKQDAISTYERALQLLPPDHASAKAARERLAALKGGG